MEGQLLPWASELSLGLNPSSWSSQGPWPLPLEEVLQPPDICQNPAAIRDKRTGLYHMGAN